MLLIYVKEILLLVVLIEMNNVIMNPLSFFRDTSRISHQFLTINCLLKKKTIVVACS